MEKAAANHMGLPFEFIASIRTDSRKQTPEKGGGENRSKEVF